METIKLGSKGHDVVLLQGFLGLKADGDFGPKTDAEVKAFQKLHGLKADGVVGPKTWEALGVREEKKGLFDFVQYDPIDIHITPCKNRKIEYIVIHYTAGASSVAGRAKKTRDGFTKPERLASTDFAIDDETIVQITPDIRNYYCWAVGDGKGKYGIRQSNSVSIEVCSNLMKGTSAKVPNHTGWYFTDEALDNLEKLVRALMEEFGVDEAHVVRHYDASRKLCPGVCGWNPGPLYNTDGTKAAGYSNENKWFNFKERLL